ncbi:MAG: HNH endonuclease [candidate division Zixibacteria bacterium]|nr:HNH endonuclease [candidate division Zixibacteria bacterium]
MGLLNFIFGRPKPHRRELETRYHKGYAQYKDKNGRWRYSHRRAAEKKLGGKIWDGFVVHHKDGNKRNNRRENLRVMSRGEHARLHWWEKDGKD